MSPFVRMGDIIIKLKVVDLAKIFDYGIMECQFDKILSLNLKSRQRLGRLSFLSESISQKLSKVSI
jgi:hypothetical protein